MKVKLSVLERIQCANLLPAENNFFTLKLIRKLKEQLGFGDAELKSIEIRQEGDRTFWNSEKDPMKEIEIGESMEKVIIDALKKLDSENKLTEDLVSLYEKFVEKPKD